jgi:hypothetical protein
MFDNGGATSTSNRRSPRQRQQARHRSADDRRWSYEIWKGVAETGVKAMTIYRSIRDRPRQGDDRRRSSARSTTSAAAAMVIGSTVPEVWRLDKKVAGSGALGDLGAHVIDRSLPRWRQSRSTRTRTFIRRPGSTVGMGGASGDRRVRQGAVGCRGDRFAAGLRSQMQCEINGSKETLLFDSERQNELSPPVGSKPASAPRASGRSRLRAYHPLRHW